MKKVFFLSIILFVFNLFSQEIEKIEPPFWWANMCQTNLQILCYGENISDYNISLSKGKLINIRKTENPNYLFILMDTQGVEAGTLKIKFNKNGKTFHTKDYVLKQRKKDSRLRKGFDSSDVIYLLMPDRFANGNPNNDSHPEMAEKANRNFDGGRHGGDIQGIIEHIDYLYDMGVSAIWSTPLLEDNEPNYSYHTYAQSDYYRIDPRYGSNADYKKLAKELHKKDMKLIMDYVTNHWGSKHWMIQDLPTKDWIHIWENEEKGFQRSNYRMSTQFDTNASQSDTKECMNGWFDTTMPDMNQSNPLLLQYMIQNAIWWIEYADLDGLRVDTYSYNDKESVARWTKAIMQEYPNFNIVAEVWMHNQAQMAYWQKDSKIGAIDNYNSYCPSIMDFTLQDAVFTMFNEDDMGWNQGMIRAYNNFTNDFLYPDINNILVFAGNHDMTRINDYYQTDINKYKLAMTLILTTRGIPQLYYGDEIGMLGNKEKNGDGDLRKDFPGGWENDTSNAFLKTGRTEKQNEYFRFTKKLLQWRKQNPVIHNGKLLQYVPKNNVYVFFRYNEKEKVLVLINNSDKRQEIDWSRYIEGIRNTATGIDIISNKNIVFNNNFSIEPKTSMIIKLQ
jgi:glycosidase